MDFIELFAGIGGFRYGLEKAVQKTTTEANGHCSLPLPISASEKQRQQYHCVWANEWDKYAASIYRRHYGAICQKDIRTVDTRFIPDHGLLIGGFPCQSFSIAGKRGGFEDTRGTLFFEICRILRAKRTPYVWLENVKGLLSHDNGATFETILGTLDELGYDCQWEVLNSKNFGVPQNRERVFIIGNFRGHPRPKVFPLGETDQVHPETDGGIVHAIDSNYHKGWLDNQQRTMVRTRSNQDYKESGVETPLRQSDKAEVRIIYNVYGGFNEKHPRVFEDISPTLRTPKGGGHLPMIAARHPLKYLGRNQRNYEGDYAFAWDGMQTSGIKQGTRIRRLTPTECERLQGFPDGWTEGISDTQRYKCLGNAVTTNVITAIAERLLP